MEKVRELLTRLSKQQIKLILNGDDLEIVSYENKIQTDQIQEIKSLKSEIISYLKSLDRNKTLYTSSIPKIKSRPSGYSLSNAQRRLWFASQFDEGSVAYNIPHTIFLDGNYNVTYFQKAIHSVIERHEILRTVFRLDNEGEVRQYILTAEELSFLIDYKDFREEVNPEEEARSYISLDSSKPFDLAGGPLLRASLLQLSKDRYIFYYNTHHIISDDWSRMILSSDVMTYYNSYVSGVPIDLLPLRIQYKDYAAWQLEQLNSDLYQEHKEFWVSNLHGYTGLIDLPSEKKRPQIKTYNGRKIGARISPETTSKLRSFTAENGGSLFMGLLAAWKVLLYRYTRNTDITIGNPVSGRDHVDLEDQIGFYVNVLALRNHIDPEDSFTAFFEQIKNNTLSAYEHQVYPFDKLLEDIDVERTTNRNPLFDILVDYHGVSETGLNLDYEDEIRDLGNCMIKFDIEFDPTEVSDGIDILIGFNKDVYEQEMIERFIVHYKKIIQALLEYPQKPIKEINFLSQEEEDFLLTPFKTTTEIYSKEGTFIDLFLSQVSVTPNATAVIFEGTSVTYKDLDTLSNQLSRYLQDHGVGKETLVPICTENPIDMILGILGVIKSGGAYVPLDPNSPQQRLDFIIEDTAACQLLTHSDLLGLFDGHGDNLMVTAIDTLQEVLKSYSGSPADIRPVSEQLAYVIYTSGTTGVPKGVMIEHGNLLDYIKGLISTIDITGPCSYGLMSTPSADLGNTVLFGSLSTGGVLHTFSRETLMSANELHSYFDIHDVDIIKIVPSHWSSLSMDSGVLLPERAIIFGGEVLSADIVKKIQDLALSVRIINHYGPTETTIGKLLHKVDFSRSYSEIPLGNTFSNTGIYILDNDCRLLPQGVVGELCIDGSGLGRGYLNRQDLTSEKFIRHPFKPGERLYKTGDLARWLPDGTVGFVGRKDNQIKIRGYRVELEEIESVLNSLYNIEQSVVLAKEDNSGSKQLVAYIVSKEFGDINSIKEGLMLVLEEKLPSYMVPNIYVKLDTIPLTSNGKIDRKALPEPKEKTNRKQEFVVPSNDKEKALVEVCESVLNITGIGMKDNFYNLGGDSIKSIQVVSRLWQKGYALKVGNVMEYPILKDMVSMMSKATRIIDQSQVEGEVILTPVQRFLFEDSGLSIPNHYNQSVILKSLQEIDSAILKIVVEELVKHHDALRMVYKKENDSWKQYNRKYIDECFRIDYHDLREEKESGLQKMTDICQHLQSGFDLFKGPLFVIGHFRLSDGDRLALICHHLVIDGISWRILLEDLSSLYTQYISGEKMALPLKTDSFQRWGILLQEYAHSKEIKKEYTYWENMLAGSFSKFPVDKQAKSNKRIFDKRLSFTLSKKLTSVMQTSIHDVYHTEINDLLLTGLGLAIKNAFGINKSVVNMEGHGREDIIEDIDISRTLGWYTAIYPLVLEVLDSSDSILSLIKVKDDLRAIPKKGIGYGIIKYLGEGFSSEIEPAIMFNYLGDFGDKINTDRQSSVFEYSSEYIGEALDKNITKKELLNVSGILVSGELTITIAYCSDEYNEESIQKLIDSYQNNIGYLIEELSSSKDSYLTPSDLSFSDLTFKELQEINKDGGIEDIYKLSPAQQGMYYHWLSSEDTSLYFNQLSYRIEAKKLDIDAIKKAYHIMVDRYAILRTSFMNHSSDTLLQVVRKSVPSSFTYEEIPEEKNADQIDIWINEVKLTDMKKGFNLEDPSQLRFKILDLKNGEYEFIWSHHHILMDGWCKSILINEFNQILNSITKETKLNLPLGSPYSDYIKWLDKIDQENTLNYWKTYLEDYSNTAKVPFARSEQLDQGYEAHKESIEFSGRIFEKINSLCNNVEATHNTLIQVVWGYLLSKYNNTRDVVYGSVVSGRPADLKGIEDMIGLFINTIPVRIKYKQEDTPQDLLKKTQQEAIAGLEHHYTSLATVQGISELGTSLLDHIVVFENYPIQEWIENQLQTELDQNSDALILKSVDLKEQANYDFRVTVEVSDTSIKVNFKYNKNRYDNASIKKIADHFYNIVDSFVSKPDQYLSNINFLSQEEEDFLLTPFKTTTEIYSKEGTFIDLFLSQVSVTPNATAVIFEGTSVTYKDLDTLSNQLSRYLQDHGVGKETLVPICTENPIDMILGILGVIKSGGAYVPLDPNSPQQRLDFIIEDTAACQLLTHSDLLGLFDGHGDNLMVTAIDTLQEVLKSYSGSPADIRPVSEQLAYVIYTSGTTGVPKGVMIEHGNLLDYIKGLISTIDITGPCSYGLMSTPSADLGNTVLFGSLSTGGVLHTFSRETLMSANELHSYFDIHDVDIIKIVPSHWSSLSMDSGVLLPERAIIFGGEVLSADIVKKIQDLALSVRIINHYGPTETTIGKLLHKVDFSRSYSEIPLGNTFSNTGIYILDNDCRLLPQGVVGELCIDGSGLGRGYLNRQDLTSEKFIRHPFKPGERLYKTGDLARWLPDGTVGFVGRKDNQIKIRGYRVELEEIESVLNSLYNIEQSVVLAKEDNSGSKQLVAYIVSKEFGDINSIKEGLMLVLEEKLPSYMVPNIYVKLDTIPLTSNGKIDRKALPVPDTLSRQKEYIPPSTETEKQLAEIWQEVLGIEKIGIQDDFFELGGNSLNAIKINSRIKKKLDLDMEIKTLFLFNSIGDLAFQIDFSKKQKEIKSDNQELKMIEL